MRSTIDSAGRIVIPKPLPRRHPKVFGLLEAGDQQVRNRLLQVVEGRVAGLILKSDDGDGGGFGHHSAARPEHQQVLVIHFSGYSE